MYTCLKKNLPYLDKFDKSYVESGILQVLGCFSWATAGLSTLEMGKELTLQAASFQDPTRRGRSLAASQTIWLVSRSWGALLIHCLLIVCCSFDELAPILAPDALF